jgi:hypothetical protein
MQLYSSLDNIPHLPSMQTSVPYYSGSPIPPQYKMNAHTQLSQTMAKDPLKLDEFLTRKQNMMTRGRNELRSIAVSPKIIQQHVFNTFHDRLKSYQHHDITLSTKHHGVRAVSQMI